MTEIKKILAEIVGTFILVFFGTAAVVLTLFINNGATSTSIYNIGITMPDWIGIGLAFGLALTVAIYAFGPISGAHFNPAVTIGLWAGKKFPTSDLIPYIVAQFIGALIASATLLAISGNAASTIGVLGGCGPFGDISLIGMFIAEFLGTFLLMYVIMATAVDKKAPAADAGLSIGLVLVGIIVAIGNYTGCGVNPVRVFSPMLLNYLVTGANAFAYYPIYLIAPIIGAIVAVYLYDYFHKEIGY
ncbi:MIP/aquaporin family protein [Methanosphaera sp. WGK6]|uniref:MIP/aquaporin family protein n=1 Tax=Methanosphaera sp. WGK6 TaxID=1561964 RepID=UPI00084C5B6C|nr:MIP/aquaporin family protein [Methanosphaera sp. WGK6]OED29610.1 porin [Methanosphaera sp. WGK6]